MMDDTFQITEAMCCAKPKSLADLRYPLLCTPKVDGIRCVKVNGRALARSFKPIRNLYIREQVERYLPDGVDGELIVGENFQQSTSGIMKIRGQPDFRFMMFDVASYAPYVERVGNLLTVSRMADFVHPLMPHIVADERMFLEYEDWCLENGYEGVCMRSPNSPYKCGRSSLSEGYLYKWTRTHTSEAVVYGFEESFENCNPAVRDELNRLRRPGGQELRSPKNTLGSFFVRDITTGVEFRCGNGKGLTLAMRQEIWNNQEAYVGRVIKYSYKVVGMKDKPRFPSFLGFRDVTDMSVPST